jgi:hypothetical protein
MRTSEVDTMFSFKFAYATNKMDAGAHIANTVAIHPSDEHFRLKILVADFSAPSTV